jgi:phosphoglycerate kinase
VPQATALLKQAQEQGKHILLPQDVVVADSLSADASTRIKELPVESNEGIYDIGPKTIHTYQQCIDSAKTIIWNGPVGVFELAPFQMGTKQIAEAIANSQSFSVAGGGDTLAAIDAFNVADDLSYISTGGGAFLEFLEGIDLPAVKALKEKYKNNE